MLDGESDLFAGVEREIPADLAATLRSILLIDHHVHGCFTERLTRAQFEESFNEGSADPIPAFMTQFDSQTGFAIRRWCAPMLGLEKHAGADEYWSNRDSFEVEELNRIFLRAAGVEHWIVDTGFSPLPITTPTRMEQDSGAPSSEILRLEALAEELMTTGINARAFPDEYRAALAERAGGVRGFKTIAAYRTGFDIDWTEPADSAVEQAVATWHARDEVTPRMQSAVLESFVVHTAIGLRLPLQVHVGFGDRDLDLDRTNPLLLLGLLRQESVGETPITLLHCYPFHREAGYLAEAFNNVYFDVGLGLNYVGSQSRQIVAESLEVAPFAKQLYSSDAFGLPELHLLGSILWRRSMAEVLGRWVSAGEWSEPDAIRVAELIGRQNAQRVYAL